MCARMRWAFEPVHFPHTGHGPLNDATLNFALVAALVGTYRCQSKGPAPSVAKQHTHIPESAHKGDGWAVYSPLKSTLGGQPAQGCIVARQDAANAPSSASGRNGERQMPRLRLSTSFNDTTGRWTSQAIASTL
jgi:hypothetical protein